MPVSGSEPRIWLIAGPTASGKSALALRLAQHVGGEIVNADALQLYTDLPLLTARPSPEEEARVPHHLFGKVDGADGWSVGHWLREATSRLNGASTPMIVVGGTGLYFKALTEGLAEIPPIPPQVREASHQLYDQLGEQAFREGLAAVDAAAAGRIGPGDRQRLCRAWEVHSATGVSLTAWQARTDSSLNEGSWQAVLLEPPRHSLYGRCDARLETMLEDGVLDEVAALRARELDPALPIMKAVGFREFAAHLAGSLTRDEALEAARQETRRYAKRQTTWARGQMADWPRLSGISTQEQWGQFIALNPALTA
jgi:tRNA dimethylallyltransferase